MAAGGAVIGLTGNETESVLRDPGHSLYVTPGAIETPERRITEIVHDRVFPGTGQRESCSELNGIQMPVDRFGEPRYGHIIQVSGTTAAITAVLSFGGRTMQIDLLNAIDRAGHLIHWEGCLGECAQGRLTEEEVSKVRVVDASNYGLIAPEGHRPTQQVGRTVSGSSSAREAPRLSLVLASHNILVQRAVISHQMPPRTIVVPKETNVARCMIQVGNCVHCATRDALMRKVDILLD
jgi:hypothetical protein